MGKRKREIGRDDREGGRENWREGKRERGKRGIEWKGERVRESEGTYRETRITMKLAV